MHPDAELPPHERLLLVLAWLLRLLLGVVEEVVDAGRHLRASLAVIVAFAVPAVIRRHAMAAAAAGTTTTIVTSPNTTVSTTTATPLQGQGQQGQDGGVVAATASTTAKVGPANAVVNHSNTSSSINPTNKRSTTSHWAVVFPNGCPSGGMAPEVVRRAVRAHGGLVPNQVLWVPTGRAPALWPTSRVVRNVLRLGHVTRPKVLALDLDETLLCAVPFSQQLATRFVKPTYHEAVPTASGAEVFAVWERPDVQLFLSTVSRLYTVVLFTASLPSYADPFVDRLEGLPPNEYRGQHRPLQRPPRIRRRYYRDACRVLEGMPGPVVVVGTDAANTATTSGNNSNTTARPAPQYTKDLTQLGVPLDSVVLVDNSPEAFAACPENGILVRSFRPPPLPAVPPPPQASGTRHQTSTDATVGVPSPGMRGPGVRSQTSSTSSGSSEDSELMALLPLLEALYYVPDVRAVLRRRQVS